jgi:hypothetical protein
MAEAVKRGVESGKGLEVKGRRGFVIEADIDWIKVGFDEEIGVKEGEQILLKIGNLDFLIDSERCWILKNSKLLDSLLNPSMKASRNINTPLLKRHLCGLDPSQEDALKMCYRGCAVILGPPGTGKTETLARLLGVWMDEGKRILLTSYQHTAIDKILERFLKFYPHNAERTLRIGSLVKIQPDLRTLSLTETLKRESCEVEAILQKKRLISCTLCAVHTFLRKFDLEFHHVVVDEASRSLISTTMCALLFAKESFVLVGDPYQLPPIIPCTRKIEGVGRSLLFYYLDKTSIPTSCLGYLYRFQREELIKMVRAHYSERGIELKGGSKVTEEEAAFSITSKGSPEWVKFGKNHSLINIDEAAYAFYIANEEARELGGYQNIWILTPFRAQKELIKSLFRNKHRSVVSTIDQSQGGEKDVIIISLVIADKGHVDKYIDEKRLNVAITRAKRKLYVIANKDVLEGAKEGKLKTLVSKILEMREKDISVSSQIWEKILEKTKKKAENLKRSKQEKKFKHAPCTKRALQGKLIVGRGIHTIRRR